MKNSIRVLFWLYKSKKNKQGLMPIYIRVSLNKSKVEISSGYFIHLSQWNKTKKRVIENTPQASEINNSLEIQRAKVISAFNQLASSGDLLTIEKIKEKLLGKENRFSLLGTIQHHNLKMKELIGKSYAVGTYNNYIYLEAKIKAFLLETFKKTDIFLAEINYEFITQFVHYLQTAQNNKQNTIAKNITLLRKIINNALDLGWMEKDPFRNYKNKKVEPPRSYLTQEEVNLLLETAMPNAHLQAVKDCIIFQIYTGLAYIDLKCLKPSNIITGIDGRKWLELKRQKTNSRTALPLLPKALEIIAKHKPIDFQTNEDPLLPVISNQKMNKQIKKIMQLCKIKKNISSHSFRRTFACTITLSNGVPIETVSKMLGHRDLKTTQIYAKVVDAKISEDMKKLL